MLKRETSINKKMFVMFLFIILTLSSISYSYAKYTSTISSTTSNATVALFGNNASIDLTNIKGAPGSVMIISLNITNTQNGKTSEVNEKFTINVDRKASDNLPLIFNLYKDKECTNIIYRDENNNYFDDNFYFSSGIKETKTYYLRIEWPINYNDINYAFEIDYLSIYFNVSQID